MSTQDSSDEGSQYDTLLEPSQKDTGIETSACQLANASVPGKMLFVSKSYGTLP